MKWNTWKFFLKHRTTWTTIVWKSRLFIFLFFKHPVISLSSPLQKHLYWKYGNIPSEQLVVNSWYHHKNVTPSIPSPISIWTMCSRLVEWQTYVDDAHLFEHLVPCPMIPYKSLLAAELERFHLRHDLIQSQECLSSTPLSFHLDNEFVVGRMTDRRWWCSPF